MTIDVTNAQVFATYPDADQVKVYSILNYGQGGESLAETTTLTINDVLNPDGMTYSDGHPHDVAISSDGALLFVSVSADPCNTLDSNVCFGSGSSVDFSNVPDGFVNVYDRNNSYNLLAQVKLRKVTGARAVSPLGLTMAHGRLYVLKNIWGQDAGVFLTAIDYSYDGGLFGNSPVYDFSEGNHVHVGTLNAYLTDEFIGPNCDECPKGPDVFSARAARPAALSPLTLIIFSVSALIMLISRRKQ
jgi:hypothetical protein